MRRMNLFIILVALQLVSGWVLPGYAGKLYQQRLYEPVAIHGYILSTFWGAPVDELHLFAYNAETQAWRLMPFQIDERSYGPDPANPSRNRWYYSVPPLWATIDTLKMTDHDGVLGDQDELVFMVRDLGDPAPHDSRPDNEEIRNNPRIILQVYDPINPENVAYGYLFRSSSITEPVPRPYGFSYDPVNDVVSTSHYTVRMDRNYGLIRDIAILPPFGNGVDIFDTQKIRFIGFLDLGTFAVSIGREGYPAANERDNLYLYKDKEEDRAYYYRGYNKDQVVRLIREVRHTLRFGPLIVHETGFYVPTMFYPFSGALVGGESLDDSTLADRFPGSTDLHVEFDLIRQSWDMNAAAAGMKVYDAYNNGLLVDGVPDTHQKKIDKTPAGYREWTLVSGEQGSLFTDVTFQDTTAKVAEFYYYDNKQGGQGDDTIIPGGDTGDSLSYGDQGVILKDAASLELGFTAYFLPKNLNQADGAALAQTVRNPVKVTIPTGVAQRDPAAAPQDFVLAQNYPNPFNQSTRIDFHVPAQQRVRMDIINAQGQIVAMLLDRVLPAGACQVLWDGTNAAKVDLPSGIYFYRLQAGDNVKMKKLILMR